MTNAFNCAVRLLARREHSAFELVQKLTQKGYGKGEARAAVVECQRLALQSDSRYAEQLCRTRISQGYGPLRISQELQAKQVDEQLIDEILALEQDNWRDYAQQAWQKKFKAVQNASLAELQKQRRFLNYRGFPGDIIASVFK